ncbi:type 1 glutamine amidotransferase domain-containing protein [Streptomyces sp. NPDC048604]|uniref:type 1 glutamine amidotransferase domain-containing protein n=1 Tax=Streptomyces sp. NPDC048604 TaxID=3365578 RepID=UPI003710744C
MSGKPLDGRNVLVVTTNHGTEQVELLKPVAALRAAGARVTVAARTGDDVETVVSDREPGERIRPDATFAEVSAADYDAVIVPGGTVNADRLRIDRNAQRLVADFAGAGKIVAAVCHGPWILVDSGLAQGRELTSYPTLRADLSNAGGTWVDREVVVDDAGGYRLITSRRPRDLDRFTAAIAEALSG